MPTNAKEPFACSPEELESFKDLVLEGGEVIAEGLSERIRAAKALAFHSIQERVIGVGALKNPEIQYRHYVFSKAKAAYKANDFPFEAGWIFVLPEHRGRGLSLELLESTLEFAKGNGVFATTKSDNEPMQRTLVRCGFVKTGSPYQSERGKYELVLFVRPGE